MRPFAQADVVRGQYTAGVAAGEQEVPGYLSEEGVAPGSEVETFVAVRAHIDNWRWDGVPFFLRTGKRLPSRATEVAVFFRAAPTYLFEGVGIRSLTADHLTIRVQPSEGISFVIQAKEPGPAFTPRTVGMDFSYGTSFAVPPAEAYERLLYDAMAGDNTLFTRQDGVERAWEVVAPVLERPGAIHPYPAGSWGPPAAEGLIAPRGWHLR
jgi:glucose-6-phosphate 1-dehydrogenase